MGYKLVCNQTLSFMLKDEKTNFLKFKYKIRISHKVKDENNILSFFFVLIKEALNTYILVQTIIS